MYNKKLLNSIKIHLFRFIMFCGLFILALPITNSSDTTYSDWKQFEDNYNIVNDFDTDIVKVYSSDYGGDMNGGVLELGDTSDRISVNFDINQGHNVKIELITYTGYFTDSNKYARINRTKVYVDDVLRTITIGNEEECVTVWNWHYCPYYIDLELTTGTHKLEIESANSKLRLDRFRYTDISSFILVPDFNVNYGSWIQAENSYISEYDPNFNIIVKSSSDFQGDMNGAVLELPDTLDKVSYSFFAEGSGDYIIDLYTYTGYNTYEDPYARIDRTKIYIDGVELKKFKGDSLDCVTVWGSHFCTVLVAVNLDLGEHILEVESVNSKIRVDRFRYGIRNNIVIPVTWKLVQEDTLPIFGYHSILNDNELITEPTLEIHRTDFINQIDYANNVLGCKWYTLADLVNNYISKDIKIPENACVMNFDDGAINNYDIAFPILKDKGVVATFYIVTNYVNQGFSGYINWYQVEELRDAGNEIAAHTMNHKDLTMLSLEDANLEIANSKQMLEDHGFNISTFAYPFGAQNDLIIDLVKDNGFIAARDTEKFNIWRRKPSVTTNADLQSNYMYLFNYYKPELVSNTQIKDDIFYNYRWQFEEGYRIDGGTSAGIFPLSSTTPTTTSYAVLNLDDSHKISSNFLVYNDGEYKIEIFGSTGVNDPLQYFKYLYKIKIFIDGIEQSIVPTDNLLEECYETAWNRAYCSYFVTVNLDTGLHELSVEANGGRIRIDKFRVWERN